ncbi:MAG: (2Fe-2S)-binding protein [Pseudomonadota bacterium]
MFNRRPDWGEKERPRRVTLTLDGALVEAFEGDSVAAALLSASPEFTRRSPVSGAPRAPYCMMGICFECLVEIDGVPNRQACMVQVRDGMTVRRQILADVEDIVAEHADGH